MDRRDLLKLMALAPAPWLVSAGSIPSARSGTRPISDGGRALYVSPSGDDRATGRTHGAAWKTITHVNRQFANGAIGPGDSVLFECGQTFYGKIRPPAGAPTRASYLTIGSYNSGKSSRRPIISSYKLLTDRTGWRQTGAATWTIDISDANANVTHTGYDGRQGGGDNVGFLKIDGAIHGNRVWRRADLAEQWDFYCARNLLHVRSSANPATLVRDIRAACDGDCIRVENSLRVTGLRLEGSGGHGIQGAGTNVRVDDNVFAELGGSRLGGTTRYGNGFQAWIDSADVVVERNVFHDVYDAALTAQGGPSSSTGSWTNIGFRDNLVYFCNQSVEFWSDGTPGLDPGFVNCVVECNTCLYAGYGWSSAVRPDRATRVHLLTYGWALPADITVRGNTFYDGSVAYRYSDTPTPGLKCSDNRIYQRSGRLIKHGDPQTIEEWPEWVAMHNSEHGSYFEAIPRGTKIDVASALRHVAAHVRAPAGRPASSR